MVRKSPRREKTITYEPRKKFKPKEEFTVSDPNKSAGLNTKLTQLETLELFNNNLSIDEIAKQRDLTKDTVINHLVFLFEKKILKVNNLDKLVKKEVQNKLKPIYEELGEKVSYDEIKLVLAVVKK
jgi:ATP-dependent DNA helicase RecQ